MPQGTTTRNDLTATMSEAEAARYLGLSRAYLRQSRMRRPKRMIDAPSYIRAGRAIRYLRADLDHWLSIHRVVLGSNRRE